MPEKTKSNPAPDSKPSLFSRFCHVFRSHRGVRIATLTAIVYAGLAFLFGGKAFADRPNNAVPLVQCAASICLSGLSVYGAKHGYHNHFNDIATNAKLTQLEERTQKLHQHLTKPGSPNAAPS